MKKIKSPCIKKCKLKNDVCISCKRTIQEIKQWRDLTEQEKEIIVNELSSRIDGV